MKIETENICKSFITRTCKTVSVLAGIDLVIERGDFVVLLGESGCGKSTLLHILAGLMPPTSGRVMIERPDGRREISGPDPSRSILFQEPALLPWLTVEENIAFGCRLRGDVDRLAYRVTEFMEMIGLAGLGKTHPPHLSAGQAQRVCLARALIGRPEALFFDEPFSSLDTLNRCHLQEELVNIWLGERFTAIFVTHDIEEALYFGSQIVILGGRPAKVVDVLSPGLGYPREPESEAFLQIKAALIRQLWKIHSRGERLHENVEPQNIPA